MTYTNVVFFVVHPSHRARTRIAHKQTNKFINQKSKKTKVVEREHICMARRFNIRPVLAIWFFVGFMLPKTKKW